MLKVTEYDVISFKMLSDSGYKKFNFVSSPTACPDLVEEFLKSASQNTDVRGSIFR